MSDLIDNINTPSDVKALSEQQSEQLCGEIRELLIETVSQNGGHLASNLGVVELTVAMHRVFDSPLDQFCFDVGHQCYTHKIITGRRTQIATIRREGGLAGFPKPTESEHDPMISGHSSTSISAACGLAKAKTLSGDKHHVIAVIGDGALTGGLAYEGLNNAGRSHDRIIVILNDNKMSINKNVGAMARYLAVIRTKSSYIRFKTVVAKVCGHIPLIGKGINKLLFRSKNALKSAIYKSTLFEDMGFVYIGPVDGHNLKLLERTLSIASKMDRPVLIHICTLKGKGYSYAEMKPRKYHGVSSFDIDTGEPKMNVPTFSDVFGSALCSLASVDPTICAVTAAMKSGTGLSAFAEQHRHRFFDVGIAEAHAVTFCAGLAANGMKPVFAVYSSFIQRAFDQLLHDAAIQKLNVTLAIDRAGIVGEDGETHQGVFDVSLFGEIPNIVVYSPAYFLELERTLSMAISTEGPAVIRYPRGAQPYKPDWLTQTMNDYDIYGEGSVLIVTYGRLTGYALHAMERLKQDDISVSVMRFLKISPISSDSVSEALLYDKILFFEEGMRAGGIGERFGALLLERGFKGKYILTAIEDEFVQHASVASSLHGLGLDEDGMISLVRSELG